MFKIRVRVILILMFGGFLMVVTRLFYLQVVCGEQYSEYAENVRVESRWTEASRGRVRAAGGELLAFEEAAYNVAVAPSELPDWRALCRPVLKLYALKRRERIAGVRDVAVMVRNRRGGGYEVSFGLAASFLRLEGTDLVERDEHGTALVVVPRTVAAGVEAVAAVVKAPPKEMLRELFQGLGLVGRGWRMLGDPCVVARDVGFLAAAEIEANPERYPGFQVVPTARRSYPYDELACHVLGYVQRVSAAEYSEWREAYHGSVSKRFLPDDSIGRAGVERALDFQLRPARGMQTLEVDAARRTQRVLEDLPAEQGADIHLTIDREFQAAVEAILDGHVGSAVFLEAATGRILAMASCPRYDPNDPASSMTEEHRKLAPLWNRAIQGQYPLGSAFKLVEAVAALEEGTALASVECTGSYMGHNCGNHTIPMHLGLEEAIKRSCNVYFYRTACEALGIKGIAKWGALFGLGQCTGVPLPGEKPGLLPTPAWKRRRFREDWFPGDTCNLGIGQGYLLVTPLQVARALAAIANGGRLVPPRLVDKIVRADGAVERPNGEAGAAALPLTPARLARVHAAMRAVCHEKGGTAFRTFSRSQSQTDWVLEQGYEIAGKTSTAECVLHGTKGTIGWFVGFAPYGNPRVAFAVALEHEDQYVHGADVAAPMARRMLERLPERCLDGVPGRDLRERTRERLAERRDAP